MGDVLHMVTWLAFAYFFMHAVYMIVTGLLSKRKLPTYPGMGPDKKIAVVFPAYGNDEIILRTAPDALAQQYSGEFDVWVLADHMQPATMAQLEQRGVKVLEVHLEKSTKGRSLELAARELHSYSYDSLVILDVDNRMSDGALQAVANALQVKDVVQAHRVSYQPENALAFLDACNEEMGNSWYRRGPATVGCSPALIGSGMGFNMPVFQDVIEGIGDTVGEDKELDMRLAQAGVSIAYLEDAKIFDQKTSDLNAFRKQRARWLAAQWHIVKTYTPMFWSALRQGNRDLMLKIAQAWMLPRTLLLAAVALVGLISIISGLGPSAVAWLLLITSIVGGMALALPAAMYKHPLMKDALFSFPKVLANMIIALVKAPRAGKRFVATQHHLKH